MAKSAIKEDVFEVLDQQNGIELRLVSWNDGDMVLEKRYIMTNKTTGERRTGRCKGLDFSDLKFIVDNWPKIKAAFENGDSIGAKKKKRD